MTIRVIFPQVLRALCLGRPNLGAQIMSSTNARPARNSPVALAQVTNISATANPPPE